MLVIEDEPIISDKIVKKLTGFIDSKKIKLESTVKGSLDLLDTFKFNIIILDLNLIDGNGITVLNKIKENNLNSLVYVFSINSELKNICLKKGATAFFDKSKDFDNLISTVKTAHQNIFNAPDSEYRDSY
ncbi:response regulator [Confluentibacter citreus]|uniref:response regulator n=1 Tax=Confluentibacter citreus TaxID=2007307 RepID=UPI0012FE0212|nr:response regulator [Confluentibacter citreus]